MIATAIVAISFPPVIVGMVLLVTWIMSSAGLPCQNFSSHLLQCAPGRLAVMEMRDILWSDWGHPGRIADTLDKIGKQPAFAEERLPFLYQG